MQKVKALFRYRIWFLISEKSMKSCAFYSCGEHMHHGISSSLSPEPTFIWTGALSRYEYIYTYRMLDFKTFLKETYAIVLDKLYIPEICCRFDNNFAIEADDEFGSFLVL